MMFRGDSYWGPLCSSEFLGKYPLVLKLHITSPGFICCRRFFQPLFKCPKGSSGTLFFGSITFAPASTSSGLTISIKSLFSLVNLGASSSMLTACGFFISSLINTANATGQTTNIKDPVATLLKKSRRFCCGDLSSSSAASALLTKSLRLSL